MLRKQIILFFFCLFGLSISLASAQQQDTSKYSPSEERSSFEERRKSIMDGNQLRATYHNFGHAGRTASQNTDELLFEYPRNTGREYMYFMSVMLAAEVPDQTGNDKFPIVDVANYRTSRSGASWNMNPITGYYNENSDEIARSDRGPESALGNTWPAVWPDKLIGGDGWPGSWNGFFGRDQFNADVEFYYRAGDDTYTKYLNREDNQFQPDSTDPTRGGLALKLDTRIMAWTQTLINSTHFNIFEVMNDASYDYDKVSFGLWIADLVAGTASDDQPQFDDIRSIAYLTDLTRQPAPDQFDGPIGEMGLKFLETPGNATDGIDNDGDSNEYDPQDQFFNEGNVDLYSRLVVNGGGFISSGVALRDSLIPEFKQVDFQERTIVPGDKIVLIDENNNRIVQTYPEEGDTVISQGREITLPASGYSKREDLLPESDEDYGFHIDLFDNDLDGLIDENRPNHLTKTTFINGTSVVRPVRYINYLYWEPGDTVLSGNLIPNRLIRQRMQDDAEFRDLVNNYYDGRLQNYFTSAPMIDEARRDRFDNDNDWRASADDNGLSGDPDTPSPGQGDGKPTSGAGTNFPGEQNIDKTDVSETDLIGITNVTIFGAGELNVDLDATNWNRYLTPGEFDKEGDEGADSDIFVSSGLFPLRRGASESFAVAITAVQTKSPNRADDRRATNQNLDQATKAYEADYQFATAPRPPKLTAVSGDGFVTLYWDNSAENSFDRYIARITGNGYDFEGYRVYRATDAAFQDVKNITDAFGNPQFNQPLQIFDRKDGIMGLHPIPVNGVQFNMGSDNGIQYQYVDHNVNNGKKYYYAVTAFDYGSEFAGIAPSESPIQISQNPGGEIIFGQNVLAVRPTASRAGYINPDNPQATLVSGSPGGSVSVEIIDPAMVLPDNTYSVVFQDTLIKTGQGTQDTLKTKNFSLINITEGKSDTLIKESKLFNGQELPITEGFKLTLQNKERLEINNTLSRWVYDHDTPPHRFDFNFYDNPKVADYEVVFGDEVGFGRSIAGTIEGFELPAMDTNFKIFNTYSGEEINYIFADLHTGDGTEAGQFSATSGLTGLRTDVAFFVEDYRGEKNALTYRLQLNPLVENRKVVSVNPQPGDTLKLFTTKPFSSNDEFRFRMEPENVPVVSADSARKELDKIKVVPNPYVVSSPYEPRITNTNRQQQHELHFTHIPVPSKLRIFTISGTLVESIDIEQGDPRLVGGQYGGTYIWDMLTKDNLELSYGVYIYYIKAPGVGETTGKFAVIK